MARAFIDQDPDGDWWLVPVVYRVEWSKFSAGQEVADFDTKFRYLGDGPAEVEFELDGATIGDANPDGTDATGYDERHGGPFDRGAADSYYRRPRKPHMFAGATNRSGRFEADEMSDAEIEAYNAGYDYNESINCHD